MPHLARPWAAIALVSSIAVVGYAAYRAFTPLSLPQKPKPKGKPTSNPRPKPITTTSHTSTDQSLICARQFQSRSNLQFQVSAYIESTGGLIIECKKLLGSQARGWTILEFASYYQEIPHSLGAPSAIALEQPRLLAQTPPLSGLRAANAIISTLPLAQKLLTWHENVEACERHADNAQAVTKFKDRVSAEQRKAVLAIMRAFNAISFEAWKEEHIAKSFQKILVDLVLRDISLSIDICLVGKYDRIRDVFSRVHCPPDLTGPVDVAPYDEPEYIPPSRRSKSSQSPNSSPSNLSHSSRDSSPPSSQGTSGLQSPSGPYINQKSDLQRKVAVVKQYLSHAGYSLISMNGLTEQEWEHAYQEVAAMCSGILPHLTTYQLAALNSMSDQHIGLHTTPKPRIYHGQKRLAPFITENMQANAYKMPRIEYSVLNYESSRKYLGKQRLFNHNYAITSHDYQDNIPHADPALHTPRRKILSPVGYIHREGHTYRIYEIARRIPIEPLGTTAQREPSSYFEYTQGKTINAATGIEHAAKLQDLADEWSFWRVPLQTKQATTFAAQVVDPDLDCARQKFGADVLRRAVFWYGMTEERWEVLRQESWENSALAAKVAQLYGLQRAGYDGDSYFGYDPNRELALHMSLKDVLEWVSRG
ncbi:hypothetical protein EJ04DRAFT_578703 [Polyplosphaeria fusca]|uniref:Uncharacterized protein n=1 Tax=Polyplosphaeria fusca TaxID=682080 RepID=A0A9P4V171_9PLEO|nr:hypothetical protein EJ04DRAFT_578703 [Polyplosphaeria fusca]